MGYVSRRACRTRTANYYVSEFGENDRITKLDARRASSSPAGARRGRGRGSSPASGRWRSAPDGLLYVADACNHRIQVFTRDGQVRPRVRRAGRPGRGSFRYPYDLAFGAGRRAVRRRVRQPPRAEVHGGRHVAGHLGRPGHGAGATGEPVGAGGGSARPGPRDRHREPPGAAGEVLMLLVPTLGVGTGGGDAPRRGSNEPVSSRSCPGSALPG